MSRHSSNLPIRIEGFRHHYYSKEFRASVDSCLISRDLLKCIREDQISKDCVTTWTIVGA
jgi:hypothetical protein